jgi:hypothetical protein
VEIESEWTARDRERQATGSGERTLLLPEPALSEAEGLSPKKESRTWATCHSLGKLGNVPSVPGFPVPGFPLRFGQRVGKRIADLSGGHVSTQCAAAGWVLGARSGSVHPPNEKRVGWGTPFRLWDIFLRRKVGHPPDVKFRRTFRRGM